MKRLSFYSFVFMLFLTLILSACGDSDSAATNNKSSNNESEFITDLTAGSGNTGGVYYPFMGELGSILTNNIDMEGFDVNVVSTGGSVENVAKTASGDFQISLAQNNLTSDALKSEGEFEGKESEDNIGVIASLFPEVVQVVTLESKEIDSIDELKGKKVGIGAPGSGNAEAAEVLLEAYGISKDDYQPYEEGFDDTKSKLQNKTIDAAVVVNAVPASTIEELQSTTKELKFIEINDEAIQMLKDEAQYDSYTMESGTYEWQDETVETAAMMGMLVANTDQVSEDLGYEMTKALFENSDDMKIAQAKLVSKDSAFQGVNDLPLHPGAKKYYEEEGMLENYEGEK